MPQQPRSDRAPVMHDVARLAGVSHQTVSRVLHDHRNVSDVTRQRVRDAIVTLGYRPNLAARTLVTSRSRTIGIVAANTTLFGPASILLAIEQAARRHGYIVNVASLPDLSAQAVGEAVRYLDTLAVAGVIVVAPQRVAADALLELPGSLPVVSVDGGLQADIPFVRVDQALGARLMTDHLLRLGHRTVHHLAGPQDWLEAEERVEGWRSALGAAGRPVPEPLRGDWSPARGYQAGRRLAADADVTAVFVANDQMALGVLRAMQEAGRRVPEDVSVGGFDDVPEAPFFGPPLTTIRQNFPALGEIGVDILRSLLAGEAASMSATPGDRVVVPELIRRGSTGPRTAVQEGGPRDGD